MTSFLLKPETIQKGHLTLMPLRARISLKMQDSDHIVATPELAISLAIDVHGDSGQNTPSCNTANGVEHGRWTMSGKPIDHVVREAIEAKC